MNRDPEYIRRARASARRQGTPGNGRPAFEERKAHAESNHQNARVHENSAAWPSPIPLTDTPDVMMFPVDVFPGHLKTLIDEASVALNVPPDYLALPMIALAGAAIGNSRHIALTRTHTEPPALYANIVGPPGAAKTPSLKILRRPFDDNQRERIDDWKRKIEAWEADESDERGPRPVLERIIVNDTTVETLGLLLHENPRGVGLVRDELSGLIGSLNQYKGGKGADKQFYLSAWSGDPIYIDRKSDRAHRGSPLHVYQPFVGIVGGIQPDVLPVIGGEFRRGQRQIQDGFIDRFAIAWPDPLPHVGERGLEISPDSLHAWTDCVGKLLGLEMVIEDGHKRPFYVQLNQSGRDEWKRFTERHANEMNLPGFLPHLVGPWSKLRGMTARIALILHFMRWTCDGGSEGMIDGLDIRHASKVTTYLKDHARRVHACMGSDPRIADARKVLQWIRAEPLERFTTRDVYRKFRGLLRNADELDAVLRLLERHHFIMPVDCDGRGGPGRAPSPAWLVNPATQEEEEE